MRGSQAIRVRRCASAADARPPFTAVTLEGPPYGKRHQYPDHVRQKHRSGGRSIRCDVEGHRRSTVDRSFRFITDTPGQNGSDDIFFHRSEVAGVTFEELSEGQSVSFDAGRDPKDP